MSELTIAVAAAPFGREMERCFATIEAITEQARAAGAGLLVLPEAALGGYVENLHEDADPPPALVPDGPELARLARIAGGDLVICAGFAEAGEDGAVHNVAACVCGDGLLGLHRKVHLPLAEGRLTTPGDTLRAIDTPVGRIGMLICYDKAFRRRRARSRSTERSSWSSCRRGRAARPTGRHGSKMTASGASPSSGTVRALPRTR